MAVQIVLTAGSGPVPRIVRSNRDGSRIDNQGEAVFDI